MAAPWIAYLAGAAHLAASSSHHFSWTKLPVGSSGELGSAKSVRDGENSPSCHHVRRGTCSCDMSSAGAQETRWGVMQRFFPRSLFGETAAPRRFTTKTPLAVAGLHTVADAFLAPERGATMRRRKFPERKASQRKRPA